MDDLWPITSRVLGVFLVMLVGAFGRRVGWLTSESDRSLARLTANLLLPALFFHRISTSDTFSSISDSWLPPLLGFGFTCFGFAISAACAWMLGPWIGLKAPASQRAFALCAGICNYGYIPLPLAEYFYPDAVVTLMVHNVGVDLALWSVGVVLISGHLTKEWKRAVFSPPLIAVVVALLLGQFSFSGYLPGPLVQMTEALGQCAIPLGLILSGAIIFDYYKLAEWRQGFGTVIAAVSIRQILLPLSMFGFAWCTQLDSRLDHVLLLQAAMPAATFPIVLVRLYDQDTATALRVVLGTSLVGVVTIPFWLTLGRIFMP
jgi:malate permease and related proteins